MSDANTWALENREKELEFAQKEWDFRKCALLSHHDIESLRTTLTEGVANRAYEDADYVMWLAKKYIESWSDEEVITDLLENNYDEEL